MSDQSVSSSVPTVAEYVIARLASLGIGHVFGVPGDYAFPFDDAIEASPDLEWVGCANELNAAYAADGYARVHGVSILSTTFGVGELSALNGVAGAKAERSPIFHLVGQPSSKLQYLRRITHHTLGDGSFDQFRTASAISTCALANLTPQNAVSETERVINEVVRHRQPGYLTVAEDLAGMPIAEQPVAGVEWDRTPQPVSDRRELDAALAAISARIDAAEKTILFPAYTIGRYGLGGQFEELLAASGFPYVCAPIGKAVISESHPQYLGMYTGLTSAPDVGAAVQGADLVIDLGGVIFADLNTSAWTDLLDPAKTVRVEIDRVVIGQDVYSNVALGDVVAGLTQELAARETRRPAESPSPTLSPDDGGAVASVDAADPLSSAVFYPRLQQFLREGDILVAETGLCTTQLGGLRLPKDASFLGQVLWGSIGWATPAAFGAAVAAEDRRVVLVTGDGSHQLTANELGAMGRRGVTPVIFVLNNGVFGVEEFVSPTQGHQYNDLAPWNYADVPAAMGCADWYCVRVSTVGELDAALAAVARAETAAYIEVVLPRSDVPPSLPSAALDRLYGA